MEKGKVIAQVVGSEEERELIKKQAEKAGLSISNYFRKLAGLPLNQTFAEKGNQRAVGNQGRWRAKE